MKTLLFLLLSCSLALCAPPRPVPPLPPGLKFSEVKVARPKPTRKAKATTPTTEPPSQVVNIEYLPNQDIDGDGRIIRDIVYVTVHQRAGAGNRVDFSDSTTEPKTWTFMAAWTPYPVEQTIVVADYIKAEDRNEFRTYRVTEFAQSADKSGRAITSSISVNPALKAVKVRVVSVLR